jgi:hypothetical protein
MSGKSAASVTDRWGRTFFLAVRDSWRGAAEVSGCNPNICGSESDSEIVALRR